MGCTQGSSEFRPYFWVRSGKEIREDDSAQASDIDVDADVTFRTLGELIAQVQQHFASIKQGRGKRNCLEVLEIQAHGNQFGMHLGPDRPGTFNDVRTTDATAVTANNVTFVGRSLRSSFTWCCGCQIILSSCNVGNMKDHAYRRWANHLAQASQCTVVASAGYCSGLWLKGTRKITARGKDRGTGQEVWVSDTDEHYGSQQGQTRTFWYVYGPRTWQELSIEEREEQIAEEEANRRERARRKRREAILELIPWISEEQLIKMEIRAKLKKLNPW